MYAFRNQEPVFAGLGRFGKLTLAPAQPLFAGGSLGRFGKLTLAPAQPLFAGLGRLGRFGRLTLAPAQPLFAGFGQGDVTDALEVGNGNGVAPTEVPEDMTTVVVDKTDPGAGAVIGFGIGALLLSLALSFAFNVGSSYLGARWALRSESRAGRR